MSLRFPRKRVVIKSTMPMSRYLRTSYEYLPRFIQFTLLLSPFTLLLSNFLCPLVFSSTRLSICHCRLFLHNAPHERLRIALPIEADATVAINNRNGSLRVTW